MILFEPNSIGLTQYASWDTDTSIGKTLEGQLEDHGITYSAADVLDIFGMAGYARVLHYQSIVTGKPVTVLLVPNSSIDSGIEEYFTFVGMGREEAEKVNWVEYYQEARTLLEKSRG